MAGSGIRLKLNGFDELFSQIEKAGGTIDQAAETCLRSSAQTMHDELQKQMRAAKVDGGLIDRMPPPEIEKSGNRYSARVGYAKGSYDQKNPSDAYKVVFLNYGTPHRTLRGQISGRGFIQKAKKKASPQIKKQQQATLDAIMEGLKQG